MITNHGIHDWTIRSGLVDTGGQNHYVNALSDTLVSQGFRVTILNRGGFPDPVSGALREGISHRNKHSRILYLTGGGNTFIRKEDLNRAVLSEEADHAKQIFDAEQETFDLVISHYWDGAVLGQLLLKKMDLKIKHVWIPHSLGALKKANFAGKSKEVIEACRFEERIQEERDVLKHVDAVASTSGDITKTLVDFYGYTPQFFLPPCIDTSKIMPIDRKDCKAVYDFLATEDPEAGADIKDKSCLLEVSRTDSTKRKDVVIRAFAKLLPRHPDLRLLLTLSKDSGIYPELMDLIVTLGIRKKVVCLGTIPRSLMPELYALTDVYCSPSEMEGFGMSVQEACACRCATVSSNRIPFAMEYLLSEVEEGPLTIRWGKAGAVVDAGNVEGFACAIERLLEDGDFRKKMAANAYAATIPYFTWPSMTKRMLQQLEVGK
ncbi:MAG: glycosyltransferase [Deltaproteobacteria bacterium]|nr:glycosyltransferase [Deltaproteobacteria bacterium]